MLNIAQSRIVYQTEQLMVLSIYKVGSDKLESYKKRYISRRVSLVSALCESNLFGEEDLVQVSVVDFLLIGQVFEKDESADAASSNLMFLASGLGTQNYLERYIPQSVMAALSNESASTRSCTVILQKQPRNLKLLLQQTAIARLARCEHIFRFDMFSKIVYNEDC